MTSPDFKLLFQAYLNGTATPRQVDQLMELLSGAANDEDLRKELEAAVDSGSTSDTVFERSQRERMLRNILPAAMPLHRTRRIPDFKRVYTLAAMLLLLVGAGYLFWASQENTIQPKKIVKQSPKSFKVLGGTRQATLTLGDGSTISLGKANDTLPSQGSSTLVSPDRSTLAYKPGNTPMAAVVYNTLATPPGVQYALVLPDSSRVWLNASSSIRFPTSFPGNERRVSITGEAYFEVAKKRDKPFLISARDVEVQVLGTHFNIMAYADEAYVNTSLLEGSVEVSGDNRKKLLAPGQESRVGQGKHFVVETNEEEVLAWKNGWFRFEAYDIEKIMRQVARWYNVEVRYDGGIPPGHFSGAFSRSTGIDQVLQILETNGIRYRIRENQVIIGSPGI